MAILLCTIEERNTIEIYNDGHAEIIMANGLRAMIDAEDVDKCKSYRWHTKTNNGLLVANSNEGNTLLHRLVLDINEYHINKIRHIDGNGLNCRKSNLELRFKEEPKPAPVEIKPTVSNKTTPSPIIIYKSKGYAEIVIIRKNNTEIRVKIDLDDVDRCKDYHWKDYTDSYYNKDVKQLHRYVMNATDDVYVKFKNNDKTDCRKANLYFEPKCKQKQPIATDNPTSNSIGMIKKPISADSNKNYKHIAQSNQGYIILLPLPNKDEKEFHGPFSNKEAAIAVYERRVDEIYRKAAMDSYETLVANLKESDPYGLYE